MTRALAAATLLVVVLGLVRRFDALPEGLHGTYFSTTDWSSSPVRSTTDRLPSTAALLAAWDGAPPEVFSAAWSGSFIVFRDGTCTIATTSDDGSFVYVDGALVVDNGGNHVALTKGASVHLTRGVHVLAINYFQNGGLFDLGLSWGADAASLEPIPSWRLTPRRPTFVRFAASVIVRRLLAGAEWLWVATLVAGLITVVRPRVAAVREVLRRQGSWRAMAAVLTVSVALNLTGIWSGLTAHTSWLGTEITPADVFTGLSRHFPPGWRVYPPVHFYILAAVYSPLLLLDRLGRIDLSTRLAYDLLFLAGRLASVVAGAGTLVALYLCGTRAFSKRAGIFAAASLALVAPFVCYAKMASLDVPYVFWFVLSLVYYVRLLGTPTLRDTILFATFATLAVCTKDQAYGLYLAAPAVMVHAIWRANREAGVPYPLMRAVLDRRIAAAAAAAALVFVLGQNLMFNFGGFLGHVGIITTDASHTERVFEPTLNGWLRLAALTASLDLRSWGWPLFLVGLAGFGIAIASRDTRRAAVLLAIPVLSYLVGFVAVILYNYDRHLLPVCAVQALFAGFALDRWLETGSRGLAWRRLAVGAVLAYSLLYAATADVLMVRDSRYVVARWLRDHADPDQLIGTAFPLRNRPPLDGFDVEDIGTIDELRQHPPAFYVLNADYARAVPPDSDTGRFIAGLQHETLGYTLAFRYRAPAPWPWLPGAHPDLVGPRLETRVASTLRDINPTFEVYRRGSW